MSHKDNCNVVLGWMPIEKLPDVTIYPEFIKEQIYNLDATLQHFVTRDWGNNCTAINKEEAHTG